MLKLAILSLTVWAVALAQSSTPLSSLTGCLDSFFREETTTSQKGVMTNIVVDADSGIDKITLRDVTVEFVFSQSFAPYPAPTVSVYMAKNGMDYIEAGDDPDNWQLVGLKSNVQVSQEGTDVVSLGIDLDFEIPAGAVQGMYVFSTTRNIRAKTVSRENRKYASTPDGVHLQGGRITINKPFRHPTPSYEPAVGVCFDVTPVSAVAQTISATNDALNQQTQALTGIMEQLILLRGEQLPTTTPSTAPAGSLANFTYPASDGCPASLANQATTYLPPDELAGVRCCRDGSTKCVSLCSGQLNGEARFKTFDEAISECAELNSRLCTIGELGANQCCSTGCDLDGTLVWTSDDPIAASS